MVVDEDYSGSGSGESEEEEVEDTTVDEKEEKEEEYQEETSEEWLSKHEQIYLILYAYHEYRVTHHVGPNLPLTLKQKFHFGMRPMY